MKLHHVRASLLYAMIASTPAVGCCFGANLDQGSPGARTATNPAWDSVDDPRVPASAEQAIRGAEAYWARCASCHGRRGDGHGPAAELLPTSPTDFTDGASLPAELELYRTVTLGLNDRGMPGFSWMTVSDRWALVDHVRAFSTRPPDATVGAPRADAPVGDTKGTP